MNLLLHPKPGTLRHMLKLVVMLFEDALIIAAFLGMFYKAHQLTPELVGYFAAAGVSIYTIIAIVTSLDIMGYGWLIESEEDNV